jgi:hypothetical protein
LSYTLLPLNYGWFTFIVPFARGLEVISPSCSWHPIIPHANKRILLSRSRRSLLSRSQRSLLSLRRWSLLSQRRALSTARVTVMTHQNTPY